MSEQQAPELRTRRPTGKPPWPMILLAGVEKSGKSYAAAAFSASDLIDRTFFLELGEGYADHYGSIPGARYEIVEHDGTYMSIGRALRAATMQPRPNGKPHAIVLDTGTELWDLLAEQAQAAANRRKGKGDEGEAQITMDLWNVAKKRWRHIVDLLRQYDGPVIITARLEQVTVMDQAGKPTTAKEWKVRAEKNLPFECDAVVKMPAQGTAILTGVRSLLLRTGAGLEVSDFTVEKLLTSMGIRPGETQARAYTAPKVEVQSEMTVEQAVAQMRRNQPEAPVEDEWTTAPPDVPDEASPSTHGQRTKLVLLVKDKRGIVDDTQRRALLGELAGRAIASSKELTFTEAHRLIDVLEAEPDHIADAEVVAEPMASEPNPRNGDTGKPLDPAAFVPSLQSLLTDSRGEGGSSVADSLAAQIAKASEPKTLQAIWYVAAEANMGGHITADQFKRLNEQGNAKNAGLSADAQPQRPPSDAPTAKQYEAADKLAKRIRQTNQLDALNGLHGTLTEARDGGSVTAIQFATLERLMDARYQVLAKAAGVAPDAPEGGEGGSHQRLAQMTGASS